MCSSDLDRDLVMLLAPYSEVQPALGAAVAEAMSRTLEADIPPIVALRALLRVPEKSRRAIEVLLGMLTDKQAWADMELSLAAASVLARHADGKPEIGSEIEMRLGQGVVNGPVAALCDGWPDSTVLRDWFARFREDRARQEAVGYPVRMKILATLSDADRLVKNLEHVPDQLGGEEIGRAHV